MNEVSKLGQPEEEPIEGVIVGPWAGPGVTQEQWLRMKEELNLNRREYREAREYHFPSSMQVLIDGEWTLVSDVPEGSITYERGPSYPSTLSGWWDEAKDWKPEPIEVEFSSGDISDETFKLMTGYDRNVLIAASKLGTQAPVPPVEPDRVKWPEGKDMEWTRTRRHSSPLPYSQWPSYP